MESIVVLNVSPKLKKYIEFSNNARGTRETARQAMNCFDLTSLKGDETKDDILDLCDIAEHNRLASVCIYPHHVPDTAKFLKDTGVVIATVINFPTGLTRTLSNEAATPITTAEDIKTAINAGARQIDVVLPYSQFNAGNSFSTHSILQAARDACPSHVTLKVILETASFQNEEMLRHACKIAIQRGADCLKTSTGKHPNGGATMEAAAILLDEAHNAGRRVGCKITGGVKTNDECARYITLARAVMGWNAIRPDTFRIGASSLLENLIQALGSKSALPAYSPIVA
jgi:deoxyribose-phosphate aldolase